MLLKTNKKLKTLASIMKLPEVSGSLGIELEVEGKNLPLEIKYFDSHSDGSLRGESIEYVFDNPRYYRDAIAKIKYLKCVLESMSEEINFSKRCSLHVHLNASDLTGEEIERIVLYYIIFEPLFHSFCREDRQYNKFALTFAQASGVLKKLANTMFLLNHNHKMNIDNAMRYSALNVECSLYKQMSLEFRGLEATLDLEKIQDWLRAIVKLRSAAIKKVDIFKYNLIEEDDLKRLFLTIFGTKVYNKFWKDNSVELIRENLPILVQYLIYRSSSDENEF